MALIAMAMPILPGKKEKWQAMMDKMSQEPMLSEMNRVRAEAGVHERTFVQGDLVIITLEGDDPLAAFGKMMQDPALAKHEFMQWAADVHGMDPEAPPPAPNMVYDSKA